MRVPLSAELEDSVVVAKFSTVTMQGAIDGKTQQHEVNYTATEYSYNANGKMTSDLNKGITKIQDADFPYKSSSLDTLTP